MMPSHPLRCGWILCGLILFTRATWGQPAAPVAEVKPALPFANPGDQIVIRREAVRLIDPARYRTTLTLNAYKRLDVVAPADGIVRQTLVAIGQKATPQLELLRLENDVQKLQLQKAAALFKAAQLELQLGEKTETTTQLFTAKLEAAKAELDLAQLRLDQTSIRSPGNFDVLQVNVTEGQYVKAGQLLISLGDLSRMSVEIPVHRAKAEKEKTVAIQVETAEVQAQVETILPLAARFDALRDLFESVASAVVVIENSDGRFKQGQTVYIPLIPRQAVAEVPSGAIGNGPEGQRKVQVVRANQVRDVPVVLMGALGTQRHFITGSLMAGDEVIFEASHQLQDGFQLRQLMASELPATPAGTPTNPAATPGTTPPVAPRPSVGF